MATATFDDSLAISDRIQATTEELYHLEETICRSSVDARVLHGFRDAMEHARRASGAVRRWVEERADNGDPFSAVRSVAAERVRVATHTLGELAIDVESGDLDFDSAGLGDLRAAVKTLNDRLARFGK